MKKFIALLAALVCAGNLVAQNGTLLGEPPESDAQRQARLIVESVESSKRAFLGELRHNFRLLWDSPDPQAVLDALGPRAGKLFAINSRLTEYLATELTLAGDTAGLAELQALLSRTPPHTVNEETGSVTILPVSVEE